MRIDDLILALQRGVDPNAAILAQATGPAFPPVQPPDASPAPPSAGVMSPSVSTLLGAGAAKNNLDIDAAVEDERVKAASGAAVTAAGLDPRPPGMVNPPIPTPRPVPPPPPPGTAPVSPPSPITHPATPEETPRIMKSPPDLSNMYIELVKKSQNAAALDSGLSTIAAGFSKYPENRAALLSAAGNRSGQQNITMADIAKIQELQLKNQALGIRQAAKAGLMKQYGLSRDTIDYLDALDKLDEVIKHKNTQNLYLVEAPDGTKAFWDVTTGKKVVDIPGEKPEEGEFVETPEGKRLASRRTGQPMGPALGAKPSDDQVALDAVNKGRAASNLPPIDMETYITTVKRDKPAEPNATDKAALEQINTERKASGLPSVSMEDYVTTIKRDPQQPANAADVQTLLQINRERKAAGLAPYRMDEYLSTVKREPKAAANEADVLALAAINKERPADRQMTMEHYLTKVKRTGTTVNVGPQGEPYPPPSPGFAYERNEDGSIFVDPTTRRPVEYPIPGGPGAASLKKGGAEAEKATREEAEAQAKTNKQKIQQAAAKSNVFTAADRALENVDKWGVVGIGSDISRNPLMPRGRAPDIYDSAISTLTAAEVTRALKEMREASPTGGALGNVTDFENRMLSSITASLDKRVDPKTATANLIRIKAMFLTMSEQRYDDKADPNAETKFNKDLARNIEELTIEHMNRKAAAGTTKTYKNIERLP